MHSTTVDEFRARSGLIPKLVKRDVEGAEELVIKGARETLASAAPTVVMEVWKPPAKNENHRDAVRLLQGLGYHPHALTDDGALRPLAAAALKEELSGGESVNFVFQKPR